MVKEQNCLSLEIEGSPTLTSYHETQDSPLTILIEIVTSRMANTLPFRIGLKN